jgi:hypothetical protein
MTDLLADIVIISLVKGEQIMTLLSYISGDNPTFPESNRIDQLMDLSRLFVLQPLPFGKRNPQRLQRSK